MKEYARMFQATLLSQARVTDLRLQQTDVQRAREQAWLASIRREADHSTSHPINAFPLHHLAEWMKMAIERYKEIPSVTSTRQLVADFKRLLFIDESRLPKK
jgi:hypothetical protein